MQASSRTTSSSGDSNNNNNNRSTTFEKNKQLVERFLQSIKSNATRVNSLDYINGYMRHWHLYEEKKEEGEIEEEEEEQQHPQLLLLDGVRRERKQIKKKKTSSKEKYSNIIYSYDCSAHLVYSLTTITAAANAAIIPILNGRDITTERYHKYQR